MAPQGRSRSRSRERSRSVEREKLYTIVDEGTLLGEGTYGKVYKARQRATGKLVALKKMKLDTEEEGVPCTAIREIALLKELSHENIVKLLDIFCSPRKLSLVFEYLENDLRKYMRSLGRQLEPKTIKMLGVQLVRGVEFCHANRVLHRDLKPQNLLIDSKLRLKLADFGLARAYSVPTMKDTHEVVTVWYRAPEILLGATLYSVPVDMWSVGCVLGEMATGQPLFGGDSEWGTLIKIFQKLGTPTEQVWPGVEKLEHWGGLTRGQKYPIWPAKTWDQIGSIKAQLGADGVDLLTQLMHFDPKRRIAARTALQHTYFADAEKPPAPEEG